jgi:crotonobetainyl-CoA:carnitine CoA-transferase CaiB-like acyl-CoA transferase
MVELRLDGTVAILRSAYAPTVQAEAGITAITERQFGQLRTDSLSHADVYTGLHAAIAILAALHHRAAPARDSTSTSRWPP